MYNSREKIEALPELLTTGEVALILRREEQTVRAWAHKGIGPFKPVRIMDKSILWRKLDVINLIYGN